MTTPTTVVTLFCGRVLSERALRPLLTSLAPVTIEHRLGLGDVQSFCFVCVYGEETRERGKKAALPYAASVKTSTPKIWGVKIFRRLFQGEYAYNLPKTGATKKPRKNNEKGPNTVPWSSFPWCFDFPWSFLTKEIPWCFECFSLLFAVFLGVLWGSEGAKNPWCFGWFSLVFT